MEGIKPDLYEIRTHLRFNTTIGKTVNSEIVQGMDKTTRFTKSRFLIRIAHLPTYIDFNRFPIANCMDEDEDPLKDCSPFNCDLKYFGQKNFFNPETQKCESVSCCKEDQVGIFIYLMKIKKGTSKTINKNYSK